MVKWVVELSEFDIEFRPRTPIKAQMLANFVVELAYDEASISTPTWSLYIDGSSTLMGSGVGIVLESSGETSSSGELALATGVKKIVIYSYSQLVVNQVQGSYEARDEKMTKYFVKAKNLLEKFEEASVVQVSRTNNAAADQLARERAVVWVAIYKAKMNKAYNTKVRPRNFQVGDLVMQKIEASGPIGKLDPKWEDPYKIIEIVNVGAYKLQQLDGRNIPCTWNAANLKKYYS
ncbi:UNVERIFIED_CONTAM: hypothetical protein Slati_1177100 [Sesamum latifolium]|uniref:RNase H type-1 domain-containing protein n=1 Tax=Sesamum latifolium TaxID=2727402 RepID=A0AAW2XCZ2_9LAMI